MTLDDVRAADFSGVTPLAVLGWPIRHSASPQMHNAALAELAKSDARFANWRYYRIEVPPERLREALEMLLEKGFVGLNLTVPHKVLALQMPNVIKDNDFVAAAGAANTLLCARDTNGSPFPNWWRFNTDVPGFAQAVSPRFFDVNEWENTDVVIIGAGGVARAIGMFCAAQSCRSVQICNRSKARLDETMLQLRYGVQENKYRDSIHSFLLDDIGQMLPVQRPLVVNATSLGLKPDDPSPIDLSLFGPGTKVFDTTYGKGFRSAFLRQSDELGFQSCDGVPMLIHQGQESLKIWVEATGGRLTDEASAAMETAAYDALGVPNPHHP